ncbi:hypothetical protein HPB47_011111 [Ixodes persulcatus]|uniref:Uncharacterized protein n=1 Tax=Ixodes persulcatus TaxID=34615 RepID=A0AC60NX83_IXOPE|nr:hypothetical protein HPB47_011111 [Ixodes persulcatus]
MLHTSLLSSKRKRDDPAAPLQDHGTAMESPSKDPSKRLCSPKMVQDQPDEDKENAPASVPHKPARGIAVDSPMEIQNEDTNVGLSKADDARTAPVSVFKEPSAVKKSALLDAHHPEQKPSKVDTLPSTVSVAARAALFENAIGTVTGTMPAPKRIPVRPTLKQAFSTVDVAPAPAKKSVSSVGSSPSTPLSNPPCTPADKMETPPPAVKSAAARPGTPKRPELPQMAIKTIPGTPRPQSARQQMFSEERLDESDLMSPEETAIFDEMDDILDEYSDGSSQADLVSLNSCTSSPAKSESRLPLADAGKKPSPQDDSAKSDVTPKRELHRTISLFRRRMEQSATPKRISTGWGFSPKPSTSDAPMPNPEALMSLGDRIRALQEEVKAQQTIISQASQALNLCQASAEFVGSPEQTEAERLLLIATQRRLACINEMQRLKASGDVLESDTPRGTLVLSELRIPAKPEMLAASKELEKNNEIIYFMFLAQYRSKVYASPVLSNEDLTEKQQSFLFREPVTISNMNEDFQVSVEVYALKTTKGVIPHDKKYHIKKTLFEEVGGYGAWTRLWCVLKGSHILCWRYPDEETTKAPLDSIDLRQCISAAPERLSIVECARPHTFKLVVVQALEVCKGDSLTTTKHSTLATTKHLFSADSKEELQEWCAKFSAALTCIRRWNPKAYKAMDIGQLL